MEKKLNNAVVSLIIAVYNADKYLQRCLDSVVKQTYTNLEIILVDDSSTDTSRKICDTYAAHDRRIIVIHQKNAGVSAARNKALAVLRVHILPLLMLMTILMLIWYKHYLQICAGMVWIWLVVVTRKKSSLPIARRMILNLKIRLSMKMKKSYYLIS